MAILADLIEVEKEPAKKYSKSANQLKTEELVEYRRAVNTIFKENGVQVRDDKLKNDLLVAEEKLYSNLWRSCGNTLPDTIEDINVSCLGTKTRYTYLNELKKYPKTTLGKLKNIADKLGFIIVSVAYVDTPQMMELYKKQDWRYAEELQESLNNYRFTLKNTFFIRNEPLYYYMLCPSSFYDPWLEITDEDARIPMYFGKGLENLKTTLGMTIPTQRNLYKMIKSTQQDINEIKGNIKEMQEAMKDFHRRLSWVESMTSELKRENESLQFSLIKAHHRISELEVQLACLLDPIYFAMPKCDMNNPENDGVEAIIGACFGVDMPVEFFAEKGLTIYADKSMDYIKRPLRGILE